MTVFARVTFAAAAALVLATGAAFAQQAQTAAAAPSDRCEGTLCDLYYSSRPAQPAAAPGGANAATAGPTVVTAPSGGLMNWFGRGNGPANAQPVEPPSASNGYMSLGAGGILGGNRGERCSGTLCDTYYGITGKGDDGKEATGTQTATAAEPPVAHRHIVHESETRPKCGSAQAGDPWHCFR